LVGVGLSNFQLDLESPLFERRGHGERRNSSFGHLSETGSRGEVGDDGGELVTDLVELIVGELCGVEPGEGAGFEVCPPVHGR
jgi:hypothetical protein